MASIVVTGDTSGSITLSAPAVAGSNTLTLPANTGTVITTASSGQSIPKAALPTGSVLQVVQSSSTTATTTTSASFVTTSHSVTITPTSSSSRILLIHQGMVNSLVATNWCWTAIFRNASVNLYAGGGAGESAGGVYVSGSSDYHSAITMSTIDSPATTSATTYTVYFRTGNAGNTVRYNSDGWKLYFIAMEIAS